MKLAAALFTLVFSLLDITVMGQVQTLGIEGGTTPTPPNSSTLMLFNDIDFGKGYFAVNSTGYCGNYGISSPISC